MWEDIQRECVCIHAWAPSKSLLILFPLIYIIIYTYIHGTVPCPSQMHGPEYECRCWPMCLICSVITCLSFWDEKKGYSMMKLQVKTKGRPPAQSFKNKFLMTDNDIIVIRNICKAYTWTYIMHITYKMVIIPSNWHYFENYALSHPYAENLCYSQIMNLQVEIFLLTIFLFYHFSVLITALLVKGQSKIKDFLKYFSCISCKGHWIGPKGPQFQFPEFVW